MAKISITGPVGSGKTTACNLVQEKLGGNYKIISIGKLQRDAAAERGMSITEYSNYRLENPEREKEIDAMLLHYNNDNNNYIFDSRLAFHFVKDTFKVALTCSPIVAAKRIMEENREDEQYSSLEEAIEKVKERRQNDRQSYINCYGIDIRNALQYDYAISTDNLTKEEVANKIVAAFKNWLVNHPSNIGGNSNGRVKSIKKRANKVSRGTLTTKESNSTKSVKSSNDRKDDRQTNNKDKKPRKKK